MSRNFSAIFGQNSSEFPTFGSDDDPIKPIFNNTENYKPLPSGIFIKDTFSGLPGTKLNNPNQKVTVRYKLCKQNAKLIEKDSFTGSVAEFAEELDLESDLKQHVTIAMMGMKLAGFRNIITPPEMNKDSEYRVIEVLLQHIEKEKDEKVSSKSKTKSVKRDEEPQEKKSTDNNPKVESPDNKNDKPAGNSTANTKSMVLAAIGGAPVLLQIIREIKVSFSNSSLMSKDTIPQTLAPQLRLGEGSTYPAQNMTYINETKPQPQPQRKQRTGVGPKLTYHVLDEGEGEILSSFRQGCFQYKEAGSVEAISFQGSPTELAIKLGPGFEEALLEAIVGMKSNGRRIIFIPHEVSGLEENTSLELKLTSIRDLNPRSRI